MITLNLQGTGLTKYSKGQEKLNKEVSYIYASNHSSLFDIPVMLATIDDNVRIIYKKELEKVPLFGPGLRYGPFIAIDRSDPRKSMKSIEEAVESIRSGDSVIIYPEGTRSLDGKLQEFKRGGFLLASRAGNPIVPISIIGTYNILPSGQKRFRKGTVKFIFHDPVENKAQNKSEEQELMKKVHEIIGSELEK